MGQTQSRLQGQGLWAPRSACYLLLSGSWRCPRSVSTQQSTPEWALTTRQPPLLDIIPPSLQWASAFSPYSLDMLDPEHLGASPTPQGAWPWGPMPQQASCGAQTHTGCKGTLPAPPSFRAKGSYPAVPSCFCLSRPMTGMDPSRDKETQQRVWQMPPSHRAWGFHRGSLLPNPGTLPCQLLGRLHVTAAKETQTPSPAETLMDRCACAPTLEKSS